MKKPRGYPAWHCLQRYPRGSEEQELSEVVSRADHAAVFGFFIGHRAVLDCAGKLFGARADEGADVRADLVLRAEVNIRIDAAFGVIGGQAAARRFLCAHAVVVLVVFFAGIGRTYGRGDGELRAYFPGVAVLRIYLCAFAFTGDVLRDTGLQAAIAGVEAVTEVGADARFAFIQLLQAGVAATVRFEFVAVETCAQGKGLVFAVVEFDAG